MATAFTLKWHFIINTSLLDTLLSLTLLSAAIPITKRLQLFLGLVCWKTCFIEECCLLQNILVRLATTENILPNWKRCSRICGSIFKYNSNTEHSEGIKLNQKQKCTEFTESILLAWLTYIGLGMRCRLDEHFQR